MMGNDFISVFKNSLYTYMYFLSGLILWEKTLHCSHFLASEAASFGSSWASALAP